MLPGKRNEVSIPRWLLYFQLHSFLLSQPTATLGPFFELLLLEKKKDLSKTIDDALSAFKKTGGEDANSRVCHIWSPPLHAFDVVHFCSKFPPVISNLWLANLFTSQLHGRKLYYASFFFISC